MASAPLPLTPLPDGGQRLDCLGLLCPVPMIKAGRAIRQIARGQELEVIADDPGVENDFVGWCEANRHALLSMRQAGGVWTTRIRREW
jgi:tRNA 2-thiouridine synthesizing protein A